MGANSYFKHSVLIPLEKIATKSFTQDQSFFTSFSHTQNYILQWKISCVNLANILLIYSREDQKMPNIQSTPKTSVHIIL